MLTSDYLRETWKIFQDGRFRAWGSDRIFKRNSKKICKYSEIVKSLNLTFLSRYSNPGKYIFHWNRHIIGMESLNVTLYIFHHPCIHHYILHLLIWIFQGALGECFNDLAHKSPELQEEFLYNSETQKNLTKNGETLVKALNFFVSSVNTLCNKTMEDTIETVKQYEMARYEKTFKCLF